MNRDDIKKIIPHRDPFLLIDEVLELEPGHRCRAVWRLTGGESFFAGHFPGRPVVPGVLILESMSQAGAMVVLSLPEHAGKTALFGGADKVKFRRPVLPGDDMVIEADIGRLSTHGGRGDVKAFVNGQLCAQAEIMFVLS